MEDWDENLDLAQLGGRDASDCHVCDRDRQAGHVALRLAAVRAAIDWAYPFGADSPSWSRRRIRA